jgi:hypothetical protein
LIVNLDNQTVRTNRDTGARKWRHHVVLARSMRGIDYNWQMRDASNRWDR